MYDEYAKMFCNAITKLYENPEALTNLNSYLSLHFDEWLKKYANTPEKLALELKCFSEVYTNDNQ